MKALPLNNTKETARRFVTITTVAWYLVLGLFHEGAHLLSAWVLGVWRLEKEQSVTGLFLKSMLGRACEISIGGDDDQEDYLLAIVRHSGWMASLAVALLIHLATSGTTSNDTSRGNMATISSGARLAAWITCLEALCTDLLGIGLVAVTTCRSSSELFFCGNFGLILIHSTWMEEDHGRMALDMLERMVHVTMMRGAQCGGVVSWLTPSSSSAGLGGDDENERMQSTGIRSRVVNAKRTDLSQLIRHKVQRDSYNALGHLRPGIRTFLGHTRFATSSKTTFEGTHPHRWTPPQPRRVYRLDLDSVLFHPEPQPQIVRVENYITHNGDFDFYTVHDKTFGLATIQEWLVQATGAPIPAPVDSAAIAGMIDLLRTAGCFGLSARYAFLLHHKSAVMDKTAKLPPYKDYEELGTFFEKALLATCQKNKATLDQINESEQLRQFLAQDVLSELAAGDFVGGGSSYLARCFSTNDDEEMAGPHPNVVSLVEVVQGTIEAFFENDLFHATKTFMKNAKGSFGLMVSSSLDAHRQICLAARGQPMSIAFYPKKGIICYGSEQAAVKVGLDVETPGGDINLVQNIRDSSNYRLSLGSMGLANNSLLSPKQQDQDFSRATSRFDLDDLGGEVVLLDWGRGVEADRTMQDVDLTRHVSFRGGLADVVVYRESKATTSCGLSKRVTPLVENEFIQELPPITSPDPVLQDIRDIPKICKDIQEDWKVSGLNRYTAWNLVRRIKHRLRSRIRDKIPSTSGSVDILLTGCEVSLWLAEQFAADMRKAFPNLNVQAVSSNKILGVFGQDMAMPTIGYPMSEKTHDFKGSIVIIVSHSGQTFAPLACSSLLQSFTSDIFLVASEWDTQIGKQLRSMPKRDDDMFSSRIFTTNVGLRPAEACSVSVVATHQLLTQILMHVSVALLGDSEIRQFCKAVITDADLQILARCNEDCIGALEDIVGASSDREKPWATGPSNAELDLRSAGDVWSNHVLEYTKAYIMTFVYVVGTVVSGYPLITGVAIACGLDTDWAFYITRFFDALLYFFFLQLSIFAIRLAEGRNLNHRTVGRTVVIGDCPWVAQCADAFLSKLFACSYSIAGLNVLSGNPADHLVHRHTHRVVRGTLLICGRPDGRLSSLTNSEVSVCLSVNQASSIQNISGSCESITIGHNPSALSLTAKDIVLPNKRPQFLCERVVSMDNTAGSGSERSTHSIKGLYINLRQLADLEAYDDPSILSANRPETKVIKEMIKEHRDLHNLQLIFNQLDSARTGKICLEAFMHKYLELHEHDGLTEIQLLQVVREGGYGRDGNLDFDDFVAVSHMSSVDIIRKLQVVPRDSQGFLNVRVNDENYFGENLQQSEASSAVGTFALSQTQHFAMELYESRVASMERFVGMCIMFHQMGSNVQGFFRKWSMGLLGYRMDRTHSIMRIATTASPVSGADVRERMEALAIRSKVQNSLRVITSSWRRYKAKKSADIKVTMDRMANFHSKGERMAI